MSVAREYKLELHDVYARTSCLLGSEFTHAAVSSSLQHMTVASAAKGASKASTIINIPLSTLFFASAALLVIGEELGAPHMVSDDAMEPTLQQQRLWIFSDVCWIDKVLCRTTSFPMERGDVIQFRYAVVQLHLAGLRRCGCCHQAPAAL